MNANIKHSDPRYSGPERRNAIDHGSQSAAMRFACSVLLGVVVLLVALGKTFIDDIGHKMDEMQAQITAHLQSHHDWECR